MRAFAVYLLTCQGEVTTDCWLTQTQMQSSYPDSWQADPVRCISRHPTKC